MRKTRRTKVIHFAAVGRSLVLFGIGNFCCCKDLRDTGRAAPFVLNPCPMITRLLPGQSRCLGRRGYTLVEVAFVFAIIGILTLMTFPRIRRVMESNRTSRAAATVAGDLERAFTLAARYRKPMRLACVCGSGTYTIADLTGGTVRLSRNLRNNGDLGSMTLAFSATPVDIYPSGVSTAPVTVTITSGISTRTIILTTAGQVRIP